MSATTQNLFATRLATFVANLTSAMHDHYGDRLVVVPLNSGARFCIDFIETDGDGRERYEFEYVVTAKPWGKRYHDGILNVEYGTYSRKENCRSKNDGTVDLGKIVADCDARMAADKRDREITRRHAAMKAAAEAAVGAAGLTTNWRLTVSSYGRIAVTVAFDHTVDPAGLRALVDAADALERRQRRPRRRKRPFDFRRSRGILEWRECGLSSNGSGAMNETNAVGAALVAMAAMAGRRDSDNRIPVTDGLTVAEREDVAREARRAKHGREVAERREAALVTRVARLSLV